MKIPTLIFCIAAAAAPAQSTQWVEGFNSPVTYASGLRSSNSLDFRGPAQGYMTAAWWIPGQMRGPNILAWKTAPVPQRQRTTFAFIGADAILPSEFSRGPQAKLSVNGKYALTFSIGFTRDMTWTEGDYQLKYISKRVEYPYTSAHRSFELNGNSGIYQLTVPASVIEPGQPATIQIELLPFVGWHNGWFMVKNRRDVLATSLEELGGEIEAIRHDVTLLREQTQILATKAYSDLLGGDRFHHSVVYNNGYRHVHPADLIRLKDGELLLMFREATEHIANDGDVVMLRSKDDGRTWGERTVIAGLKDVDEREGCGVQLKDGTIVVGIFYNNLYSPEGVYAPAERKRAMLASPQEHYLGSYTIASKDNGHTWSSPAYIDTAKMPFTNIEGPTDAPIEMPDGALLMGVIGYSLQGDAKNTASIMLRSADQGKSWSYLSTIASDPGGKLGGFMEPGIARTRTGRIVVAMRNSGVDQAVWVTHSDDNGRTWVPVTETAMIGHPVDLLQLSDGRLMATYGIRNDRHTTPGGVRACFSGDDGVTWDILSEVQLRSDFLNWDTGYPESIETRDGAVLTVYYFNLFNKYFIGSTRWKP